MKTRFRFSCKDLQLQGKLGFSGTGLEPWKLEILMNADRGLVSGSGNGETGYI